MNTPANPLAAQGRLTLHPCASPEALAQDLAAAIARQLRQALDERPQALLAVSGGKSPVALFNCLSQQALAWERVTVLLADERCVPASHPDSNSALVRQHLLQNRAASAQWVPFFEALPATATGQFSDEQLDALAQSANQRMAHLPWPLDALVLGMGEDGHTASLFPGALGLDLALQTQEHAAWVCPSTAPHARLTLTLHTLLQARAIHLPLAGERKRSVFEHACLAPTAQAPISLVLHQALHPTQVWLAP